MPFIPAAPPPAPPEQTGPLKAYPDPRNSRIRLELTWPGVTTATVTRIVGATKTPVRSAEAVTVVAGLLLVDDYEAPPDVTVTYQATSPDAPEVLTSTSVALPSNRATWLRHPGTPSLNVALTLAAVPVFAPTARVDVLSPIDRAVPLAIAHPMTAGGGPVELWTFTQAEDQALRNLLADGSPIQLAPPGDYGIGAPYLAIVDAKPARLSHAYSVRARRWVLEAVIVDRPVGAASGRGNTYADWLAAFPTFAALKATGYTNARLQLGVDLGTGTTPA